MRATVQVRRRPTLLSTQQTASEQRASASSQAQLTGDNRPAVSSLRHSGPAGLPQPRRRPTGVNARGPRRPLMAAPYAQTLNPLAAGQCNAIRRRRRAAQALAACGQLSPGFGCSLSASKYVHSTTYYADSSRTNRFTGCARQLPLPRVKSSAVRLPASPIVAAIWTVKRPGC